MQVTLSSSNMYTYLHLPTFTSSCSPDNIYNSHQASCKKVHHPTMELFCCSAANRETNTSWNYADVCVVDFKDMMNTSEEMCLSMMFNIKKDMRNDCFTVISLMSLSVYVWMHVCISLNSIAKDMGREEQKCVARVDDTIS